MNGFWPNLTYALILIISILGLLCIHFLSIRYRVTPLEWCQFSFLLSILITNWWNLTKFWYWQPRLGFLCVSVFANLQQGYGPWFMSEFRFHSISWEIVTEFHKILHMHWYWKHLDLDCFQFSQINNIVMTLDWCWNFVSAQYLWNKLMEFDQILHMHWYWQDLGWEMLSSYFTNLWPLIDVRISFLLNILRNDWQNLTKFCICIDIENI